MTQLIPVAAPPLSALVAAAGERAVMPLLEFFADRRRDEVERIVI